MLCPCRVSNKCLYQHLKQHHSFVYTLCIFYHGYLRLYEASVLGKIEVEIIGNNRRCSVVSYRVTSKIKKYFRSKLWRKTSARDKMGMLIVFNKNIYSFSHLTMVAVIALLNFALSKYHNLISALFSLWCENLFCYNWPIDYRVTCK
jgi:hypothetical protein